MALRQTWMTQLILAISLSRGYLPLMQKDSSTHIHGLAVYVKDFLWHGTYRAFSSSLLRAIITQSSAPFQNIFKFCKFCPNFQMPFPCLPFFPLFLKNHMHALTF